MRERINRLAKGIIDTEVPVLVTGTARIEEPVRAGERTRKELNVMSGNGLHIKGLAYSSNARVVVTGSAFGGLRNHIGYEVNSAYLEYGDVIEGSFYLVTNGGEEEIPYSFRVEAEDSGRILGKLLTAEDFAAMAKQDYELALRLFEYQDFAETVPFMQDLSIRALYDGIKGHGSRPAQLEEFFVALGVKTPVRILVAEKPKQYGAVDEITKDIIEIFKEGWGYLPITVKASGDFIQLSKNTVTAADFEGDVCKFAYQIAPSRLHGGRNFGAITFFTPAGEDTVSIQVTMGRGAADSRRKRWNERYGRYLQLRLDYESQVYEPAFLLNQMKEELEQLKMVGESDETLKLLTAEHYVLSGQVERAVLILDEVRGGILERRQEQPDLYCMLQYISIKSQAGGTDEASFVRLLHKYLDEGAGGYLQFYFLTRLDDSMEENPGELFQDMKQLFLRGCHSPFLYLQALKLLKERPELFAGLGNFELQVLHFAARRKQAGETLAVKAAKLAGTSKHYNRLCCRILAMLYEEYPKTEILEAICGMMIRGDRKREADFIWYERAMKAELSLTRLYEYYLYSLPKDYDHLLPREILLYFSYDRELDRHSKSVLYKNILTYMKAEDPLYKDYERKIGAYATVQLFEGRINSRMAVIYDRMIYKDMIDLPVARVLPGILKSYRITCRDRDMKYVVICYEELMEEGIYPLIDGTAYAPLFSSHSRILFQDAYGTRYADVHYVKTSVMEKPELEAQCFRVYPDHPMLLLKACREAAEKEQPEEQDVLLMERALTELKLHPLYKKKLTASVIGYYQKRLAEDGELGETDGTYLLSVDKKTLTKAQRAGICETLISLNYIREAYEIVREYGFEEISMKRLLKLCTRMILEKLFDQDELLLKLAYHVFSEGMGDSVILDYLCEFYNGTCDQMYQVLMQGVKEHVETYDLEERLLAQMLFADNTGKMDKVFSMYMEKKTSESIVKAYFTKKSADYFLRGEPADNQVFAYLEGMINGSVEREKLSTIYLLALTKYYAGLTVLDEAQKELCQAMVDILLEEGMVFPYFKDLAAHVRIPEHVMDKAMIQYRGQKDSKVELEIQILPDEEEFHRDEIRRVYQGIFVRQKILFEGEKLNYRIYQWKDGERQLEEEGTVSCDIPSIQSGSSRFGCHNEMAVCLSPKEEEGLKRSMQEYLMKTASVEALFDLK